jgi:hypothetical protein
MEGEMSKVTEIMVERGWWSYWIVIGMEGGVEAGGAQADVQPALDWLSRSVACGQEMVTGSTKHQARNILCRVFPMSWQSSDQSAAPRRDGVAFGGEGRGRGRTHVLGARLVGIEEGVELLRIRKLHLLRRGGRAAQQRDSETTGVVLRCGRARPGNALKQDIQVALGGFLV